MRPLPSDRRRPTVCASTIAASRGGASVQNRALWVVLCAFLAALVAFLVPRAGRADEGVVPAELQAELLSKLAAYDRNFPARAGDMVHVLVVVKTGDARSKLSAASMQLALSRVERIGGLPHQEKVVQFESGDALAKLCKTIRASIVYVTPGLDDGVDAIRTSLRGVDVLSVAAVADYVPRGVVLGFELLSGKPRITLNLEQAKLQNVNFKADALSLMKVYR
jgi:hypothetical protein